MFGFAKDDEAGRARAYLTRLAEVLRAREAPPPATHDWAWRAQRTVVDLEHAPDATVIRDGDRFVLPYPGYDYPDSMVQLAIIAALRGHGARAEALADTLMAGVSRFFDAASGTFRRYLPGVDASKDYDAIDSWYLYHPMMSLAALALRGDAGARVLLLQSVEYGIRAARHFEYRWPVFYRIQDFGVIQQRPDARRSGETDAAGIYAYVMMQLHELTRDARFVEEAGAALSAADGRGLALMYQINLTGWGAAACARLWAVTGEEAWIGRCCYWLANLFHHCDFRGANPYPSFMGARCMYNSDYFAAFEDHESFTALGEVLRLAGAKLDPDTRMLIEAYRAHAADGGWYHYPDMLPPGQLSRSQESGHIDRSLSFPLEDLYLDGRAAGQVGQEIYGAGAAFTYAAAQARIG